MTGLKYINNVLLGTGVTELKLYFFCLLLYNTKYRQQGEKYEIESGYGLCLPHGPLFGVSPGRHEDYRRGAG